MTTHSRRAPTTEPSLPAQDQTCPLGCPGTDLLAWGGAAQDVGARQEALPEVGASTAVAACDGQAGGGGASRHGAGAHIRAPGCLFCRLPTRATQHCARTQVVLARISTAAAVALEKEGRG